MQYYCLRAINNQKNTTINLNQYMIRHLPIKSAPPDQKKTLSKKVQNVINALLNSNEKLNGEIVQELRQIDDIIFELYEIDGNERETIVSDIKNRIDFFKKVYQ